MARTIKEIYDAIILEKATLSSLTDLQPAQDTAQNLLDELTSGSKVAIWRLWALVTAVAIHALETYFDMHTEQIEARLAAAKYGSLPWYVEKSLAFQLGWALVIVDNFLQYAEINEASQIVKYASAQESGGIVFVKVAKEVSAAPGPLSVIELAQFSAYLDDIKPAGILLQAASLQGDELRIEIEIGYNPLFDPAIILTDIEATIIAYLADLPFDSVVARLTLEDRLQAVEGVQTITVQSLKGVSGLVIETWTQTYQTKAGYIIYDDQNSTITMTAI